MAIFNSELLVITRLGTGCDIISIVFQPQHFARQDYIVGSLGLQHFPVTGRCYVFIGGGCTMGSKKGCLFQWIL